MSLDNADNPQVRRSRALMLAVDVKRNGRRSSAVRAQAAAALDGERAAPAEREPDGGLGLDPWFTEFAADGRVLFDATLPHGGENYRAYRFRGSAGRSRRSSSSGARARATSSS